MAGWTLLRNGDHPDIKIKQNIVQGGYIMSWEKHALSGEWNSSAQRRSISECSGKDSNECQDEKSHSVTKIH